MPLFPTPTYPQDIEKGQALDVFGLTYSVTDWPAPMGDFPGSPWGIPYAWIDTDGWGWDGLLVVPADEYVSVHASGNAQ